MSSVERAAGFGNQLVEVHLWLREELERLHEDVESFLDGSGRRPRDLRAHCLTFCTALERHHTGEDGGAFAVLAEQVPELRPTLEQLARDHRLVTEILANLRALLDGLGPDPSPDEARRVRGEVGGLTALLDSHFGYEERRLVAALNELDHPAWAARRPDFLKRD